MNKKWFVCMWMVFFLILSGASMATASDKINWHSYGEALALARQDNKKIFVHFYADWCGYCKKMEKETLSNPEVIDSLNRNFIPVRVNSDKERKLTREFFVRGLPSTWFVSPSGEKINSIPGYVSAEMLMNVMKFIHTDSYKKMTFKDFLKTGS